MSCGELSFQHHLVPCGACVSRARVRCGSSVCPSSRRIWCTGDRGTSGRPGPRSVCTWGACLCSTCRRTPSRTCRTWSPLRYLEKRTHSVFSIHHVTRGTDKQHMPGSGLTFGRGSPGVALHGALQGERDAQELHVAVSIPHQQLLARPHLLTGLVEDVTLHLHRDQVLLLREPSALHQGHPVPGAGSAVHEMTQHAVLEHLDTVKPSDQTGNENTTHGSRFFVEDEVNTHLPHQGVVVVRLDLAGVDEFSLERSEAGSLGDAALVREDPTVGHVSPRSLEDG